MPNNLRRSTRIANKLPDKPALAKNVTKKVTKSTPNKSIEIGSVTLPPLAVEIQTDKPIKNAPKKTNAIPKDMDFVNQLNFKNAKTKGTLSALYEKTTEKTRDKPRFNSPIEANVIHQVDLLELPEDTKGGRYAITVVDQYTRFVDCEQMKDKQAVTALAAIKKIYKRGIIKEPSYMLTSDLGKEFLGEFQKYFEKKILVKKALVQRHRQIGVCEARNKKIGKLLFLSMTKEELETGKASRNWAKILPDVVKFLNAKQETINKKKANYNDTIRNVSPEATEIFNIGQKVRVKLDRPIDVVTRKPLIGNFRESDIRFSIDTYEITDILLQPNQPVMYRISDHSPLTVYSFFQLQKA